MINVPMGKDETLNSSTWIRTKDGLAIFVCPNGHPGGLRSHAISEDGTVHPSVVCGGEGGDGGCDFHEYIKLDGWSFGKKEAHE